MSAPLVFRDYGDIVEHATGMRPTDDQGNAGEIFQRIITCVAIRLDISLIIFQQVEPVFAASSFPVLEKYGRSPRVPAAKHLQV
jgi:hypothetical protein